MKREKSPIMNIPDTYIILIHFKEENFPEIIRNRMTVKLVWKTSHKWGGFSRLNLTIDLHSWKV